MVGRNGKLLDSGFRNHVLEMIYFTIYNWLHHIIDGPFNTRKEARRMIETWKRLTGITFEIQERFEPRQPGDPSLTEYSFTMKVIDEKRNMIKSIDRGSLSEEKIDEISKIQGQKFLYKTRNL